MTIVKSSALAKRLVVALAITATLVGCTDTAPPVAPQARSDVTPSSLLSLPLLPSPTILRFKTDAPPLEQYSVSVYAKKGQATSLSLYFKGAGGGRGEEYARLVIPSGALAERPNGTRIAVGDSVLITVSVPDRSLLLLRMEPHGLKFDARSPARLTMSYRHADPDLNGDGRVNLVDTLIELRLSIWRQPTLIDLFTQLTSILDRANKSVSATLPGFSQYVIAY
jgi:hypothetical protein